MTPALVGLAAIAVWVEDAKRTDGCVSAGVLIGEYFVDFMTVTLHLQPTRPLWGVHPTSDLMNRARRHLQARPAVRRHTTNRCQPPKTEAQKTNSQKVVASGTAVMVMLLSSMVTAPFIARALPDMLAW